MNYSVVHLRITKASVARGLCSVPLATSISPQMLDPHTDLKWFIFKSSLPQKPWKSKYFQHYSARCQHSRCHSMYWSLVHLSCCEPRHLAEICKTLLTCSPQQSHLKSNEEKTHASQSRTQQASRITVTQFHHAYASFIELQSFSLLSCWGSQ